MRCSTMKDITPAAPPLDALKLRSFAASAFTHCGLEAKAAARRVPALGIDPL
jgi:hypothetical protein